MNTVTSTWSSYSGPEGCQTALQAMTDPLRATPDRIPDATWRRRGRDGLTELVCRDCKEGRPCTG